MRTTISQIGPFIQRVSATRSDKTPIVDRALNLLFKKTKEQKPGPLEKKKQS